MQFTVYEAPPLRDGNGREVRRLQDVAATHLRPLKVMDYEPSGPFGTSIFQLKLDSTTMFEWQRHSHDSRVAPPYMDLLNFLDLRPRASENSIGHTNRRRQRAPPEKTFTKQSYHVNVDETCVACKSGKHSLYTCKKFRSLPHR